MISAFEKATSGAKVELNSVPYEQMFTNIDAQLQAGNPPDLFRVPYYTFGAYAGRGAPGRRGHPHAPGLGGPPRPPAARRPACTTAALAIEYR